MIVFSLGVKNPYIQSQVSRSYERFMTMETVTEGDLTAGGTATRATDQSQRVLSKWKESPIFGWGFSEEYRNYINEHVGNQNILLHSGILGLLLMFTFFLFFHFRLLKIGRIYSRRECIIFLIFFIGWFIIHSTSGQHFAYYQMPKNIMAQSLYFSFGALIYWNVKIGRYA
jgi:O-antigen ligase